MNIIKNFAAFIKRIRLKMQFSDIASTLDLCLAKSRLNKVDAECDQIRKTPGADKYHEEACKCIEIFTRCIENISIVRGGGKLGYEQWYELLDIVKDCSEISEHSNWYLARMEITNSMKQGQ